MTAKKSFWIWWTVLQIIGNDHRIGTMDSWVSESMNHFLSPCALCNTLISACLASFLFMSQPKFLNFLIILTHASSPHILLTPWNFLSVPRYRKIKYILWKYFSLSPKFFEGGTESAFCPEFSHKTFPWEVYEILEPKPFKWFFFLNRRMNVLFLVSVTLKEWNFLWSCSQGNSILKVKKRRHLICAFLTYSYLYDFCIWQGKILWFCSFLLVDLTDWVFYSISWSTMNTT